MTTEEHDSPGQRQAVALRYRRSQDHAPRVTATGRGRLAEAIMQKARDAGVPLLQDADLMQVLGKVPLGDTIPRELFQAVAEVLAYVYRVNKTLRQQEDG
ncbi:MAG: EscU/YscU/HrcU family type III secretion system export apparatus switch protein [Magnetococcales bacterium]|nr:EscU/YscU/HrcU family type III secretion system export apparatus switch protein [Magnetococcales bacterium]